MLDAIMWGLTTVGLPAILVSPLLLRKNSRAALFLLLTMIAAGVLAVEIQFAVLRPRPEGLFHFGAYFPSFPSGHAAIAFAWAVFLALSESNARARIGAIAFAALIAISRVSLGHHHLSDVIMGAVLGSATAAISYGAFYSRSTVRPHWAWWLWPQLALVLFAGVGAYLGLTHFRFLQLPYMDKTLHFVLFGLLAFFLVAWFPHRLARTVALLLALVAIGDESLQALSPVRSFDLVDLSCTLAGIAIGALAGQLALDKFRRPDNLRCGGHALNHSR